MIYANNCDFDIGKTATMPYSWDIRVTSWRNYLNISFLNPKSRPVSSCMKYQDGGTVGHTIQKHTTKTEFGRYLNSRENTRL